LKNTETIYGVHPVRVLLERHPERVVAIRLADRRDDPRVREIEELARKHGRPVQRADANALKHSLGDVAHQGVVAEISPLPPWSEDDLLDALQSVKDPLLLALDGVQDPHNLGACLRTADACGALAVIVPRDRAAQVNATVRKVAVGAAETTPVVAVTNLVRTLKLLKEASLWIVGADAEGAKPAEGSMELRKGGTDEFGHERFTGVADQLAQEVEKRINKEVRVTVLGHVQRGGTPTAYDRVLATRFGVEAMDAVHQGDFGTMVALKGPDIVRVPLADAIRELKTVDRRIYDAASVFFG